MGSQCTVRYEADEGEGSYVGRVASRLYKSTSVLSYVVLDFGILKLRLLVLKVAVREGN
jgi:hypothetical protein